MNVFTNAELAEILKGFTNHRRLAILFLLSKQDNLILESVAERLHANYKTIAVHLSRMHRSGLITKTYQGQTVVHALTPRGKYVLKFLRTLE